MTPHILFFEFGVTSDDHFDDRKMILKVSIMNFFLNKIKI